MNRWLIGLSFALLVGYGSWTIVGAEDAPAAKTPVTLAPRSADQAIAPPPRVEFEISKEPLPGPTEEEILSEAPRWESEEEMLAEIGLEPPLPPAPGDPVLD